MAGFEFEFKQEIDSWKGNGRRGVAGKGKGGGRQVVDEVNKNLQKSKQTNKSIKIKFKQNKILIIKIIIKQ